MTPPWLSVHSVFKFFVFSPTVLIPRPRTPDAHLNRRTHGEASDGGRAGMFPATCTSTSLIPGFSIVAPVLRSFDHE